MVGVDDMASHILWTKSFLEGQSYNVDETIIYQDNKSAIMLENNGHWRKGKHSKHIAVRYFFIKDRIDNKEVVVEWFPDENMRADFFTKPLQGPKFVDFRDLILNIQH